jgi:Tfp pilus assembly protein PilO
MKSAKVLLASLCVLLVAYIVFDLFYFSKYQKRFKSIEKERIVTSNKLATAKIISENLKHVRELVFDNMEFANKQDSVGNDMALYKYLTESANDLKMRLVSISPRHSETKGRVTTFGYNVELEGDFFSFGEFCSKLENNRRIMALTQFTLAPLNDKGDGIVSSRRALSIKLQLNTYKVRK